MIDTVEAIYRNNKFSLIPQQTPFVLLTTSNEARRQNIVYPFWSPIRLNIRQNSGSSNNAVTIINSKNNPSPMNGFSTEYVDNPLSAWTVENEETVENGEQESLVDFAVVQKWDGGVDVQWIYETKAIQT